MARIELVVGHRLALDEALARLQALGEYYQHRHHAQVTWQGHDVAIEARYLSVRLQMNARLDDAAVHVDAPDPGFLLRRIGSEYLRKKLERYLDPKTALETLPRR